MIDWIIFHFSRRDLVERSSIWIFQEMAIDLTAALVLPSQSLKPIDVHKVFIGKFACNPPLNLQSSENIVVKEHATISHAGPDECSNTHGGVRERKTLRVP